MAQIQHTPTEEGTAILASDMNARKTAIEAGANAIVAEDLARYSLTNVHTPRIMDPLWPMCVVPGALPSVPPNDVYQNTLPAVLTANQVEVTYQTFVAGLYGPGVGPEVGLGWRIPKISGVGGVPAELTPQTPWDPNAVGGVASRIQRVLLRASIEVGDATDLVTNPNRAIVIGIGFLDNANVRHVIERSVRHTSIQATLSGDVSTMVVMGATDVPAGRKVVSFFMVLAGSTRHYSPGTAGVPQSAVVSTATFLVKTRNYTLTSIPLHSGNL